MAENQSNGEVLATGADNPERDAATHCHMCNKKFFMWVRKRQCQRCRFSFCVRCMTTSGTIFNNSSLCSRCAHNDAQNSEQLGSCCTHRAGAEIPKTDPRKAVPLEIGIMDDKSHLSVLPWEYQGARPASVFKVRDREAAFNLSLAGHKSASYKVQLTPTKGCSCFSSNSGSSSGIQSVTISMNTQKLHTTVRILMGFTGSSKMYVCVIITTWEAEGKGSNKDSYAGLALVDVQKVGSHIRVVRKLSVKCVNMLNPQDEKDCVTLEGSYAWKLYNLENESKVEMDNLNSPMASPKVSQKTSIKTSLENLKGVRQKLDATLKVSMEDERLSLEKFNHYTFQIQKRMLISSEMGLPDRLLAAGTEPPNETQTPPDTSKLTIMELRKAKQEAWRSREMILESQKKLNQQLCQVDYLVGVLEKPDLEWARLCVWCPQCTRPLVCVPDDI